MDEELTDSMAQEENDKPNLEFVSIDVLHKNEEKLIIGFSNQKIAFLNIRTTEL